MDSECKAREVCGGFSSAASVLCVGEAMILFGADEGSLSNSATARLYVAGAEANVALGLAHLGQDVEWFGRVGEDPFGTRICRVLSANGVDVSNVVTDIEHGTGLYFKEWASGHSQIYYYRTGSAAAHLNANDLVSLELKERRLCHVSGITPALSPECDAVMGALLLDGDRGALTVSFDVNYRPKLWPVVDAAPRILELARGADIVMVGRDEAEVLWGTTNAEEIRTLIPSPAVLVVKDAEVGATSYVGGDSYFVPALSVDVVESIGAGDAFAAGFLSAWLDGADPVHCLRLGHVMAAYVLGSIGDAPVLPPIAELLELTAASEKAWGKIHIPNRAVVVTSADSTEGFTA